MPAVTPSISPAVVIAPPSETEVPLIVIALFVNDAFGASHRKHSSVYGISFLIDSYSGFLLENEYKTLKRLSNSAIKNSVLILGGAKIEDKSGILNNLVDKVDKIIIGGGMISNFLQNSLLNFIYSSQLLLHP